MHLATADTQNGPRLWITHRLNQLHWSRRWSSQELPQLLLARIFSTATGPVHNLTSHSLHTHFSIILCSAGTAHSVYYAMGRTVRCPERARDFSLLQNAQTGYAALPALSTGEFSSGGNVAEAWSWPLAATLCRNYKWVVLWGQGTRTMLPEQGWSRWKISARKQTDIGKQWFVNRTIKHWNQLPAEVLGTFPSRSRVFRKRVRKIIISEVKWKDLKRVDGTSKSREGSEKWVVKWSEDLSSHWLTVTQFVRGLLYSMFFVFLYPNCSFYVFIIRFMFVFLFCFLFCVFCVLFLLMYTPVSFLFVHKFTDDCHRVKTKLQLIHIIYLYLPHDFMACKGTPLPLLTPVSLRWSLSLKCWENFDFRLSSCYEYWFLVFGDFARCAR
jgi:hypothetical protein